MISHRIKDELFVFTIFIVQYEIYYRTVHNKIVLQSIAITVGYLKWVNHFITTEYNAKQGE